MAERVCVTMSMDVADYKRLRKICRQRKDPLGYFCKEIINFITKNPEQIEGIPFGPRIRTRWKTR